MLYIGRNGNDGLKQLWLLHGPFQHLLSAKRRTDQHLYFVDFQKDAYQIECFDHIAHRHQRKIAVIAFDWILERKRTCTAVARTDYIHAHDKIVVRIEAFVNTEQTFPPFLDTMITGKRMANPHHVGAVFVELSPGL